MVKCAKGQGPAVENSAAMENIPRAAAAHPDGVARESLMTQPLIAAAMGVSPSTVKIRAMTSAKKSLRTMLLNPSTPCAPSPRRRSSPWNASPKL